MDPNEVHEDEILFRAIKSTRPDWWNEKENRLSSSIFIQSNGCSVDRDGNRLFEDITELLESIQGELRGVAKIPRRLCDSLNVFVQPDPLENNPYHANLQRDETIVKLKPRQAKELAKQSEYIPLTDE